MSTPQADAKSEGGRITFLGTATATPMTRPSHHWPNSHGVSVGDFCANAVLTHDSLPRAI